MTADQLEVVEDFATFGIQAFTTTRAAGTFGSNTDDPGRELMARWRALQELLAARDVHRLATAPQVHGAHVLVHGPGWEGWLRSTNADGHFARARGTAMAVTIADCVPVFIAHPSGACAILHSGWRGTAARIIEHGIARFADAGAATTDLRVHLGPAICGACYEVSPDVVRQLTGRIVHAPERVDLRALIASHARALGVTHVTTSTFCTRCHNDRFYSHRAGDAGRQLAVIFAPPSG